MIPYESPEFEKTAFNCPHCSAYAQQLWEQCYSSRGYYSTIRGLETSKCAHCGEICVWYNKNMIYPCNSPAPFPHENLPEEIKKDYEEARAILNNSSRGAAALLRLAVQKLCKHLGGTGKDLNADIACLVKEKHLPVDIQKSLDIVRVIGNNAVHPGQIDIRDDKEKETASKLFDLVNLIAEIMIAQPKKIEELYKKLPESQTEQIKKRDEG